MKDLSQEFSIENCSINVKFLQNKIGKTTVGAYLLSIIEIRNSVWQIGLGTLFFVNNYVSGLIWGNDSTGYLFDSHRKDENGNLPSSGTAAFLKFDTLHSLQSYIIPVYYNTCLLTLCFQGKFIKVDSITKNAIKYALKKERLSARWERDLAARKRKYYEDPKNKLQAVKKR